ncbi:chemotaxis protein CheW [Clostridium beijerinckii]|uniref:chemotaxis protein CheW n=1 Tax=Clostridium beijerinckii TaxID=1520 RepID=UPI00047BBF28|nr:chemotaxis protein CheW [Clostridium beijerinckii]
MSDSLDVMIENKEDTQKDKYLIFSIGQECYGIDIKYVIEIIGVEPITEIPEVPKYIRGVINLRGKIIPVMDVRVKLKKEEKEYDDRTCIIVVQIENIDIGLIIDKVIEVANIDEKNISPPPKVNLERCNSNSYIKGIAKIQNEVRLLIDCNRLLKDDEIEELKNGEV